MTTSTPDAVPDAVPDSTSVEIPKAPCARIRRGSQLLMAGLCLLTLIYGMLPGLLAVCVGHLLTSSLARVNWRQKKLLTPTQAATVVIALPLLSLLFFALNARGMVFGALAQYQQLMHHLASTVLEIRQKLPPDLAAYLPEGLSEAQSWLVDYLQSQAQSLTHLGTTGLRGGLLVYVGLIIGALMVGTASAPSVAPLRLALRQRGMAFMVSFRQIVVAQFWIASFNTLCTVLLLFVGMPLGGVHVPYSGTLVTLTFVAGLVPIVGNLLCNGVLTLAGISVSPTVGVVCLLFLVGIHKFEYFINAKIVGRRTNTTAWELLAVMFFGEAVFGLAGLVAAPLYYAYAKRELHDVELI